MAPAEPTTATAVELLRAGRARIADPWHWCQGANARDAAGRPVGCNDPRAVRFCAAGAFLAGVRPHAVVPSARFVAWAALVEAAPDHMVLLANDELGHAAVLAMYDRAIAQLEGQRSVAAATAALPPQYVELTDGSVGVRVDEVPA